MYVYMNACVFPSMWTEVFIFQHFHGVYVALRRTQQPEPGPQMIGKPTTNTVSGGADPFAGGNKIKPKFKGSGTLSKASISAPSEFRHLSHVGFDPSTGAFDVSNSA